MNEHAACPQEASVLVKQALIRNPETNNYHGIGSDGKEVIVESWAFIETRRFLQFFGLDPEEALKEAADPDQWDMRQKGCIRAGGYDR